VAIGASATVLLATVIGMPISTTHAMVGSIVGIGLSASALNLSAAVNKFFVPLLISPLIAITLAAVGANGLANHLLEALNAMRAPAGDVWMGWQFAENRAWPIERPSWTAGALLLAYDVTARRSNGASVFLESLPERPSDQSTATADTDEVSRYA